jgi:hypothetical protein
MILRSRIAILCTSSTEKRLELKFEAMSSALTKYCRDPYFILIFESFFCDPWVTAVEAELCSDRVGSTKDEITFLYWEVLESELVKSVSSFDENLKDGCIASANIVGGTHEK